MTKTEVVKALKDVIDLAMSFDMLSAREIEQVNKAKQAVTEIDKAIAYEREARAMTAAGPDEGYLHGCDCRTRIWARK